MNVKPRSILLQFVFLIGGILIMFFTQPPLNATSQADKPENIELDGISLRILSASENSASQTDEKSNSDKPQQKPHVLTEQQSQKLLLSLPTAQILESDNPTFNWQSGPKPPKDAKSVPINQWQDITHDNGSQQAVKTPSTSEQALSISKMSPTGELERVKSFTIVFSQAMYALGQRPDGLVGAKVDISPKVKGQFTWLDNHTLRFDADDEFLQAHTYKITILADSKASSGQRLEKETSFSFSTQPLTLETLWPEKQDVVSVLPILILNFNTSVNVDSLIEKAYLVPVKRPLTSWFDQKISLRLANDQDFEQDPLYQSEKKAYFRPSENQVAFIPTAQLKKGENYQVVIEAGVQAKQGDLATVKQTEHSITVHKALNFIEMNCGRNSEPCEPRADIVLSFNNPLVDPPKAEDFEFSPEISDLEVVCSGSSIHIRGTKMPNTKYTLTLKSSIKDIFGNEFSEVINQSITTKEHAYWGEPIIAEQFVVAQKQTQSYSFLTNGIEQLQVQVYKVSPEQYRDYLRYSKHFFESREGYLVASLYSSDKALEQAPGELRKQDNLTIENPKQFTVHSVDLQSVFPQGMGHAIIAISGNAKHRGEEKVFGKLIWLQKTNIGLASIQDSKHIQLSVAELDSGKPMPSVQVELLRKYELAQNSSTSTNSNALGQVSIKYDVSQNETKNKVEPVAILARQVNPVSQIEDVALLPFSEQSLRYIAPYQSYSWYVVDDRNLYRPGEQVSIKGWLRKYSSENHGQLHLPSHKKLEYVFTDSTGKEQAKGELSLSDFGGFDLQLRLKKEAELGYYQLYLKFDGASQYHNFRVEEFRRPEFEVLVSSPAGPHISQQNLIFDAKAQYFAGGALGDSQLTWQLSAERAYFSPANLRDYFFGQQNGSLFSFHGKMAHSQNFSSSAYPDSFKQVYRQQDQTDPQGRASFNMQLSDLKDSTAISITASASVEDFNHQQFSGSAYALIHPASHYVGLKTQSRYYQLNELLDVSSIVSDLNGQLLVDKHYEISIKHLAKSGFSQVAHCQLNSSLLSQTCTTQLLKPGQYQVESLIVDELGRKQITRMSLWVMGGHLGNSDELNAGEISFSFNDQKLHIGDELRVLLQTPFSQKQLPAQLSLDFVREGVIENRVIQLYKSTQLLSIKLDERFAPGFTLIANGTAQSEQVAFARGQHFFKVKPDNKLIDVELTLDHQTVLPGAEVELSIKSSTNKQELAGVEVAIFVVDEAVLASNNYRIGDPIDDFFSYSRPSVLESQLRSYLYKALSAKELADKLEILNEQSSPKSKSMSFSSIAPAPSSGAQAGFNVRSNFSALALFSPRVITDGKGEAKVKFTVPDSLTRYRITAIAAHEATLFGIAETDLTAKLSVSVRPMPPRFAYVGDEFELPVIVQNLSAQERELAVALRSTHLELTQQGQSIKLAANARAELVFSVKATKVGLAQAGVVVVDVNNDAQHDAAHFTLAIQQPMNVEHEAIYGDTAAEQQAEFFPIDFPKDSLVGIGGLSLNYSSSALQNLSDAYLYLFNYPYNCTEQLSSKIIAVSQLGALLNSFNLLSDPDQSLVEQKKLLKSSVKELLTRQQSNGGFGLWTAQSRVHVYASIHTMHALLLAQKAGVEIDPHKLKSGLQFISDISGMQKQVPDYYSDKTKRLLRSYAIYIQSLAYEPGAMPSDLTPQIDSLFADIKPKLSEQLWPTVAWLLAALDNDQRFDEMRGVLLAHIINHIDEKASSAHVAKVVSQDDYVHMASTRKGDALVLQALLKQAPESLAIPKLAQGLLDRRIKGRWLNTQENAQVLLSLKSYFDEKESIEPNFTVSTWLGQNYAGKRHFEGYSTQDQVVDIPEKLIPRQSEKLIINKQGQGRLYYRVGLEYAKSAKDIKAKDLGFSVTRDYQSADNDPEAVQFIEGAWHIKAGALVRVNIKMATLGVRHYIALTDPLPAGFEVLNQSLANSVEVPTHSSRQLNRQANYYWSDHENLRDQQVEVFSDHISGGEYHYSYVARATSKGTFIAPPLHVEEMYHPENYGQTKSEIVIIK